MKILKTFTYIDPALRFVKSASRWAANGFATADEKVFRAREQICFSCKNWDKQAFGGSGKCKLCGCSKLKLKFATEHCPMGKWDRIIFPKSEK